MFPSEKIAAMPNPPPPEADLAIRTRESADSMTAYENCIEIDSEGPERDRSNSSVPSERFHAGNFSRLCQAGVFGPGFGFFEQGDDLLAGDAARVPTKQGVPPWMFC